MSAAKMTATVQRTRWREVFVRLHEGRVTRVFRMLVSSDPSRIEAIGPVDSIGISPRWVTEEEIGNLPADAPEEIALAVVRLRMGKPPRKAKKPAMKKATRTAATPTGARSTGRR